MDTAKLELGIIGDFLTGHFAARPSPLKGETCKKVRSTG